jgi:hypothetical protein
VAEIPDDDAARQPALTALTSAATPAAVSSDDPEGRLAYDGSDGTQQSPFTADEWALLHRVVAW